MTAHHCLYSWDPHDWLDSWRNFWDFNLRMKEENCFLSSLPPMAEWNYSCCDVGNCQHLLFISTGRGLNKHRRLTKRVGLLCLGFGILLKCSIVLHAKPNPCLLKTKTARMWLVPRWFLFFFSQSETICNLHSCYRARRTALLSQPIRIE